MIYNNYNHVERQKTNIKRIEECPESIFKIP